MLPEMLGALPTLLAGELAWRAQVAVTSQRETPGGRGAWCRA